MAGIIEYNVVYIVEGEGSEWEIEGYVVLPYILSTRGER